VERATEWGVHLTPESFVLSSQPDGSRFVNLDAVSRKVRKVADQLGMKSVHLHSLRHFAATELLAGGVSPHDAAEMLGHADPSLTLRSTRTPQQRGKRQPRGFSPVSSRVHSDDGSSAVVGFHIVNQVNDAN